jgi:sugar (pentulose or hexulose) kinase
MFPIDTDKKNYNTEMVDRFNNHIKNKDLGWKLGDILPEVLSAGGNAGTLTAEGAGMLDQAGDLEPGIPLCPPEGDAGTGMAATNSVRIRTGNVSAGTSVFAMIVLEKDLANVHHEIDQITTPDGHLVAMAHSNNCSTEYSAWIELFGETARILGCGISSSELYDKMMKLALEGDPDCGGILAYGYHSGEHLTGFTEGRPLLVRRPDDKFTPANIIRAQLFTSLCALRTGLDILTGDEGVEFDEIKGHGGFFKTKGVGDKIMAAALNTPVSVLDTAGEGGAWGIALLAAYLMREDKALSLTDFLHGIFSDNSGNAVKPDQTDVAGFQKFFERYQKGLAIEQAAVDSI